jgi:hypothetical protein
VYEFPEQSRKRAEWCVALPRWSLTQYETQERKAINEKKAMERIWVECVDRGTPDGFRLDPFSFLVTSRGTREWLGCPKSVQFLNWPSVDIATDTIWILFLAPPPIGTNTPERAKRRTWRTKKNWTRQTVA